MCGRGQRESGQASTGPRTYRFRCADSVAERRPVRAKPKPTRASVERLAPGTFVTSFLVEAHFESDEDRLNDSRLVLRAASAEVSRLRPTLSCVGLSPGLTLPMRRSARAIACSSDSPEFILGTVPNVVGAACAWGRSTRCGRQVVRGLLESSDSHREKARLAAVLDSVVGARRTCARVQAMPGDGHKMRSESIAGTVIPHFVQKRKASRCVYESYGLEG